MYAYFQTLVIYNYAQEKIRDLHESIQYRCNLKYRMTFLSTNVILFKPLTLITSVTLI